MLEKTKKLFWIARPVSWLNTAYPFAAGYLVAGGSFDLLFVVATLYFLGPYNLLMYGVNDVFDYESDIRNPRKGGIEGMREQRSMHPTIIKAVWISNLPFIVAMVALGSAVSTFVLGAVLFLVVAYSLAKLRFKERPIIDSVTSSLHFVGPLLYALSLTGFQSTAWPYVVAFFLWGVASHALGAIQDILPDRRGGIASIATFFGAKTTMRFVAAMYLASIIIVLSQPLPYSLIGLAGLAYVANIAGYLRLSDQDSQRANKPWRRFIWLNLFVGFIITIILILNIP